MKFLLVTLLLFTTLGCQSINKNSIIAPIEEDDYNAIIDTQSPHLQKYQGFYNTVDLQATLLRPKIRQAIAQKKAELYLWNTESYEKERIDSDKSMASETQMFLAFYSPDRRIIDFTKKQTVWKVFLDVAGKRYDGTITKNKIPLTELKALFPYLTPFHSNYNVTFPVAMTAISTASAKLIMSGPFETAELSFPAE